MSTWNPLKKAGPQLNTKPLLSQGLVSHDEDRELEMTFVRLQEMEENSKKLYKEVRRYEDCLTNLQKTEDKLASDLVNSSLDDPELKTLGEQYSSVVYHLGHTTEDLAQLAQKTVVDPMKKLTAEFPQIQEAVKRRDLLLSECLRCQQKWEQLAKKERTGGNIVKAEQAKRSYQLAKEDFDKANRLMLLELPQFYARRMDYFQPCLQALIRSQVEYYGESTRQFTSLVNACPGEDLTDQQFQKNLEKQMSEIKTLSIVGS